jgi:hypothetical protein
MATWTGPHCVLTESPVTVDDPDDVLPEAEARELEVVPNPDVVPLDVVPGSTPETYDEDGLAAMVEDVEVW